MDFKSGQQLIGLCETNECPISEIMLIREETFTEKMKGKRKSKIKLLQKR